MKNLLVLLALVLFLAVPKAAFAETVEITKQSNAQLFGQYKEAVVEALISAKKDICKIGPATNQMWNLPIQIDYVTSIAVTDGAQPLLVFTSQMLSEKVVITITTSADYKRIESVLAQKFENVRINHGDLKNPDMKNVWVVVPEETCRN